MSRKCPKCGAPPIKVRKFGYYIRKSDSQRIRRFYCPCCRSHFSSATFSDRYRQNKRRLNDVIYKLQCSGVSQRRIALLFGISRTTVARKLKFNSNQARLRQKTWRTEQPPFAEVQFDDLETIEHSKCKPVSVTLAVDAKTRKVIDYRVARIPAKGLLAKFARKKYGPRADESRRKRRELFSELQRYISPNAVFSTDQHMDYPQVLNQYFPKATHLTYKREPSSVAGQGELKKVQFDPIFAVNHTLAMLRANINRLFRRTWCTTKKLESLDDHLAIYIDFHNRYLTN